ncbi:MAG: carboxypeptidase-like regulatory domain-containing protein, partial [Acidobacteriota bacterium]|nr:carboxypeptidase-like regulatory domain-containing protein [Acidobacteriota bacterium]
MRFSQPFPVTVVLLLVLSNSFAQQHSGTLKGTVTDQLGSLVIKATILLHDARGFERKTSTNSSGVFEFRGLPAGKYDVKVLATGFELSEEKSVEVNLGQTTTLDLELNIASVEQSVTVDQKGVSTDSDRNGDAVVLRGRDLEVLPSDPEALAAALQAMAGPNLGGENGGAPQVKVDGFSNGQMPPKEAIREIRVNQNPYSAENEYPGWGGIEIFTQPGSEKLHGGGSFSFNDESLNSRNPFAHVRAPFQQRSINANLTGPLVPKRASFAAYLSRYETDSNAIVNATILDSAFKPVGLNQSFVTPLTSTYASGRVDLKLNKKHTMVGNYEYNENAQNLQGIGGFSLPSRATTSKSVSHVLQFTETAVLSEKMINETRLQISHSVFQQNANSTLPALNVQDSFFGGGAQTGIASNRQSRAEVQNFLSWSTGNHFLKFGERFRYVKITSISPANFGGTYTFAGGSGPLLDA